MESAVDDFNLGSLAKIDENWMNSDASKEQSLCISVDHPVIDGYGHLKGDLVEHEGLVKLKKSPLK